MEDSQEFKDWLIEHEIKRVRNTEIYNWRGMMYEKKFFFEKYTEDKNKQ